MISLCCQSLFCCHSVHRMLVLVEAQVVPLEKKQVEFMKNKCSEKLGGGD